MVQAIIFDCFGVLTTDRWKEFVSTLEPNQAEQARALMYEHDAGRLSEDSLSQQLKQVTDKKPERIEEAVSISEEKNYDLLAYIKQLKATYKIGLLSNIGSNWIRDEFLSDEEQQLFDAMIFSHDVGLAKPDHRIFEHTIDKLGVNFEDAIFIDDSASNCAAARQLGIKTIVYEDFAGTKLQLEALLK